MYDLKIEDLFYAYYCTRKNKRNTLGQLEFESNLETNLIDLYNDLISGNYQLTPCICFIIEDPVKREVFASNFRDRIVHHLIYNYLSPIFEKKFIYDSYSCRKGNLTSQLFSNIYLNDFDHWIKRECKIKHYGRYVDDFYIIHHDKNYLKTLIPTIDHWLKIHLHLTLHPRKIHLQHFSKGVSFLGLKIKPYHRVLGSRIRKNLQLTFNEFESQGKGMEYMHSPTDILSRINSYLGFIQHSCSYNFRREIFRKFQAPYRYGYYIGCGGKFKFVLSKIQREI